jgi:hypothetical protein
MPIVHQATADPAQDLVVTLALICVGSLYTEYPGASSFSDALSELIRRLLGFMVIEICVPFLTGIPHGDSLRL